MSYRVCIPTAGTGSRLGDLTKYINKSLVGIANRPTLSHLIEQFPHDAEFVIALGHKGHLVREFIELAYPDRTFLFSEVSPFEGPGSGLGLSLLSCMEHLQQPFVFISCDTLIKEPVPKPDHNWMGYANVEDLSQYRTVRVVDGRVWDVCEKGDSGTDLKAYVGLAGVHDYDRFWRTMEKGGDISATGEAQGMRGLLPEVSAYGFTWFDTGNPEALQRTREAYREQDAPNILAKDNEAIWFIGDRVIKFSDDEKFIENRVKRVKHIEQYTPVVLDSRPHMYLYRKVRGSVLSDVVTLPLFSHLLETCRGFWVRHDQSDEEKAVFRQTCNRFYKVKTLERIALFYGNFERRDSDEKINDESMPKLNELIEGIDWEWMTEGFPGRFHGDFHFENIIWSEEKKRFVFLDWRQEFGGSLATGDIYYDFAKLMHGLIISHELIDRDLFHVEWKADEIRYDFHRKQVLVECERVFNEWLLSEGYDLKKVRVLTALVYLNIAALHHYPYSLLLYALGKKMLKEELEKQGYGTDRT